MRLADNLDKHTDEFEFWPDWTIDWSNLPFSALPIAPIDLQWGKFFSEDSDFVFHWRFIKLAGKENSHAGQIGLLTLELLAL